MNSKKDPAFPQMSGLAYKSGQAGEMTASNTGGFNKLEYIAIEIQAQKLALYYATYGAVGTTAPVKYAPKMEDALKEARDIITALDNEAKNA